LQETNPFNAVHLLKAHCNNLQETNPFNAVHLLKAHQASSTLEHSPGGTHVC